MGLFVSHLSYYVYTYEPLAYSNLKLIKPAFSNITDLHTEETLMNLPVPLVPRGSQLQAAKQTLLHVLFLFP